MSSSEQLPPPGRVRREPPAFRQVEVRRVEGLSPRLIRVTLAGPSLEGLTMEEPAASVRLLLPPAGDHDLVMPSWNGNEFLRADGGRPTIRTFTPARSDPSALELDLEIVIHGGGAASDWAQAAVPGDSAAVSGPGRGYVIDARAPAFLLAGDETTIPAIRQLLGALPEHTPAKVHVEVADPDGRLELPAGRNVTLVWSDLPSGAPSGETLVAAVAAARLGAGTRIWAAGEAAAMQRIRRQLFDDQALPRSQATVRGYWSTAEQKTPRTTSKRDLALAVARSPMPAVWSPAKSSLPEDRVARPTPGVLARPQGDAGGEADQCAGGAVQLDRSKRARWWLIPGVADAHRVHPSRDQRGAAGCPSAT